MEAIIWDFGGVLLRTEDLKPRQQLAEKLGFTSQDLEHLVFGGMSGIQAQLGSITADDHWGVVGAELSLSPEGVEEFRRQFFGGDRLDSELIGRIRSLRTSSRTALLSNAFDDLRDLMSNLWKIDDAFDEIIVSAEEGLMKPDPRIYHRLLEKLKIAPDQAVFIDDFIRNIEGARQVGIHAIHFQNRDQAWNELTQLLDGEART